MFNEFLKFLLESTLFTSTIVVLNFVLCWFFYDKVLTKGIDLKDALFQKDNLSCWIEFIGAFVFPVFYLSALGIEGSMGSTIFVDWAISISYALVYVLCFFVLRLLSNSIVKIIGAMDSINMNEEVFEQKNTASAIFSVTLSLIFVSIVVFFDYNNIITSLLQMGVMVIFSAFGFLLYTVTLDKKTTIFKEVFVDNNTAASVSFIGFIYSITYLTKNAALLQESFNLLELVLMDIILIVILYIITWVFRLIFIKLLKVNMFDEVYEQNNIGSAIGESALYIGIAMSLIHFLK